MPDDILTPQEAARLLGCNEKTLRKAIKAKRITAINVGSEAKPRWIFRRADVERFELIHEGRAGAGHHTGAAAARRAALKGDAP
jgi:excisionase family DNA binding protein